MSSIEGKRIPFLLSLSQIIIHRPIISPGGTFVRQFAVVIATRTQVLWKLFPSLCSKPRQSKSHRPHYCALSPTGHFRPCHLAGTERKSFRVDLLLEITRHNDAPHLFSLRQSFKVSVFITKSSFRPGKDFDFVIKGCGEGGGDGGILVRVVVTEANWQQY